MRVNIVYALPDAVWERTVETPAGARVRDVIESAGLLDAHPTLRGEPLSTGVFGRLRALDDPVYDGDRVEIYRPLKVDPKEARRIRADIRRRNAGRKAGS